MGKPLRALIIEDSEDDTQLLLRELRDIGYEVEFERVETAEAMEAVLTEKTWDLILSDYTMPKFSALQALEVLKASRLDLPFIIISGTIGEETAVAALKAGAHDFLVKGNFARLGSVIEQELREAQSRRERRQAEQALQTSEELFGTAFHHSPVGICITTLDGRLQNVSQSLVDMLGFTRTELEGKHFNDITHPDDLEIEGDAVSRMMSGKIPSVSFEKRYLHKTGEPVWALVSSSLLRDSSGQPVHFITHILDMTERKHAEDAVHESETHYHDLFENSPISLWEEDFSLVKQRLDALRQEGADFRDYFASHPQVVTELAGLVRVTDVNRAALELYKTKEKKELLGSLLEVVHKSALEHFQDELLSLMSAQASFAWEGTDTTLNGEQIQVSVQCSIPEGHLENWSKVIFAIQDITPRKHAEAMLKEERNLLRTLIDNLPDRIFVMDTQGRKTLSNTADWEASGGKTMEDVIGKTDFDTYPPELAEDFWALDKAVLDSGVPVINYEEPGLDSEGNPVWVLSTKVPLLDSEGKVAGLVGIGRDITERKQAEKALQDAEAKYRSLVEQLPAITYIVKFGESNNASYISPQIESLLGFSQEEWLADANLWAKQLHPADREHVLAEFELRDSLGQPINIDYRLLTRDGHVRWFHDQSVLISDESGQPHYAHGLLFDITERKRTEATLHKSAAILSQAGYITHLGAWEIEISNPEDLNSNPLHWSDETYRIFGYEPREVPSSNALFFERVHPEDRQKIRDVVSQALAEKKNYQIEHRIIRPDGAERTVFEHAEITFDPHGRPTYILGALQDITERKQAENELRTSEERFRQLADNIQEAFWITDAENGKEIYLSPAAETIWGRPLEELMHKPYAFLENILPEDRPRMLDVLEKQKNGQKIEIEYRIVRPDGSERWIRDRAFPILDGSGRVTNVAGITADITEGKQAEAEIRQHLIELEALYENGLAVGRLLEPREIGEQIIETFSRHLSWHHVTIRLRRDESDDLELIAFNLPHLDGKKSADAERKFISHVKKVGEGMSGWVVQTGKSLRTGNLHEHAQYVHTFEGMQSGLYMPLKIANRVIGVISVESEKGDAFTAQDERLLATLANQAAVAFENARLYHSTQQELSERMRAEELLEHERNLLAQRVAERTSDLSRANSNLARALRVKDEFLANMSHELRTPLNAILGLSESLGEQIAGPLNEKQLKYITTISESGHHLLSLINDILDLAKIEAGQITLDINKVDVNSVCQASLRMIKQLAQKKKQDVTLEIDDGISLMWADERRLKQMIVNLLGNAVKFTPEDGNIGLEVHGNRDENKVAITVWDNGIGIKESDLPQLFQPFVQLDAGIARGASGTGLGLALVAQMARLHGGSVSASGQPGTGSRFTIVLPWEPALAADTEARLRSTGKFRAVDPHAENKRTILLIEDTEEVTMMLRDYLELAGYKVLTAQDGLDGITQAKLNRPDLILMDIQMPHMDGFEATQRLRNDPEFKYTPIIALTALAMPNDRERCLAAGMDEYISKPVNLKALVKIIQGCLSKIEETRS